MRIAVLTDSNSGMTPEDARENGIELMSMPIFINGKSYMENVDITQEQFYEYLRQDANVSTSQPSVGEMQDEFDRLLKSYDSIVFIPMSAGLSGTCQTAAMRSVFGKQAHLYLVDLICHGVPSPLLWKAYLKTLEQENGAPVVWASFRTKENGWFRGQYQIYFKVKGREERLEDTRFFEMFFRSRYVLRESCHACP